MSKHTKRMGRCTVHWRVVGHSQFQGALHDVELEIDGALRVAVVGPGSPLALLRECRISICEDEDSAQEAR